MFCASRTWNVRDKPVSTVPTLTQLGGQWQREGPRTTTWQLAPIITVWRRTILAAPAMWLRKAVEFAGDDPDLKFDLEIFCKASGGSGNEDRATIGVPSSEPRLEPYPTPNPKVSLGGQRLFDTFYWIGDTGVGAWLITSNDGYICLLYTSPSPRDGLLYRMPSSA